MDLASVARRACHSNPGEAEFPDKLAKPAGRSVVVTLNLFSLHEHWPNSSLDAFSGIRFLDRNSCLGIAGAFRDPATIGFGVRAFRALELRTQELNDYAFT